MEGEIVFLQDVMRDRLSYLDAHVDDTDTFEPLAPPSLEILELGEKSSPLSLFKIKFSTRKPATLSTARAGKSNLRIEDVRKEQTCRLPMSLERSRSHFLTEDTKIDQCPENVKRSIRISQKKDDFPSASLWDRKTAKMKQCSVLTSDYASDTVSLRHECFIDCKVVGDVCNPKLSSVAWLTEEFFVVVDESNEKLKQFCIAGQLVRWIVMEKVLTVTYANGIIYCGLKNDKITLLNTEFLTLHVLSHSGICIPVAIGRENPRVFLIGNTSIHTLNQKGTKIIKSQSIISTNNGRKVRLQPMHPHRFRENELVVSDWYSLAVFVIKSDGSVLNTYTRKDYIDWKPGGLCCDKDDNIYIADYVKRELIVLNAECENITTIKLSNIQCPRSLDCSSTDKLLLTFKDGVSLFQISKIK